MHGTVISVLLWVYVQVQSLHFLHAYSQYINYTGCTIAKQVVLADLWDDVLY